MVRQGLIGRTPLRAWRRRRRRRTVEAMACRLAVLAVVIRLQRRHLLPHARVAISDGIANRINRRAWLGGEVRRRLSGLLANRFSVQHLPIARNEHMMVMKPNQ